MAKTRSKGPATPNTPLSQKGKKTKLKNVVEESPSVKKVKKGRVDKKESPKKKVVKTQESDEIVSDKVATGAISELKKYIQKESKPKKQELFDDEDNEDVYLQVTTKKFYSNKPNFKPKVIKLSNPILSGSDIDGIRTCLFVRDNLITSNEQIEAIENENISSLKKIHTLHDLKTEFKPFEKKRQLYNEYDLFLVDEAILSSMPSVLGKVFYASSAHKFPLPIRVTSSSKPKQFSSDTFKNQLEKSLSSTSFLPPVGVNISIKFGAINKTDESALISNLKDILSTFNKKDIRSIMIKTASSPALPLFYNENIYDNDDVSDSKKSTEKSKKVDLTPFERGLLEIGDSDEVIKIVGKKLKQKLQSQS